VIAIFGILSLYVVLFRTCFLLLLGSSSLVFVVVVVIAQIRARTLLGFLAGCFLLLLRAFLVFVIVEIVLLVVVFI
jgi:hypothetical protein